MLSRIKQGFKNIGYNFLQDFELAWRYGQLRFTRPLATLVLSLAGIGFFSLLFEPFKLIAVLILFFLILCLQTIWNWRNLWDKQSTLDIATAQSTQDKVIELPETPPEELV